MIMTMIYLGIIFIAILVLIAYIICRRRGKKCLEQTQPENTAIIQTHKKK